VSDALQNSDEFFSMPHPLQIFVALLLFAGRPVDRAWNLLSEDHRGAAGNDEPIKLGPEISLVRDTEPLPGEGVWLAWDGPSPNWAVVWPTGKPAGVWPSANAAEPVALDESSHVIRLNKLN
jgi:hypothetical protein